MYVSLLPPPGAARDTLFAVYLLATPATGLLFAATGLYHNRFGPSMTKQIGLGAFLKLAFVYFLIALLYMVAAVYRYIAGD